MIDDEFQLAKPGYKTPNMIVVLRAIVLCTAIARIEWEEELVFIWI
jgi:hypothetical protein